LSVKVFSHSKKSGILPSPPPPKQRMISLKFIEIPYDSGGSKLTRPRTQAVRTKATKFPSIRYKEEEGGGGGGG